MTASIPKPVVYESDSHSLQVVTIKTTTKPLQGDLVKLSDGTVMRRIEWVFSLSRSPVSETPIQWLCVLREEARWEFYQENTSVGACGRPDELIKLMPELKNASPETWDKVSLERTLGCMEGSSVTAVEKSVRKVTGIIDTLLAVEEREDHQWNITFTLRRMEEREGY